MEKIAISLTAFLLLVSMAPSASALTKREQGWAKCQDWCNKNNKTWKSFHQCQLQCDKYWRPLGDRQ